MITSLPAGMQTRFFPESESNSYPAIVREGTTLLVPVFIRAEQREGETIYRYFNVPVRYVGQDYADYDACLLRSYADIRKYFYGDAAVQGEMRDDHTWEAHRQAIRTAFPKHDGDTNPAEARYIAIKEAFWDAIGEALEELGKTRKDLPDFFTAEVMLKFATDNGMTPASIAKYAQTFSTLSLDLLHNDRNWAELFNA